MKKLTFMIIFFASLVYSQSEVNWKDASEAFEESIKSGKTVLLYVKTEWCAFCRKLNKESFQNKDIAEYINQNFIPAKLDAASRTDVVRLKERFYTAKEYAGMIGIKSYPTIVFYSKELIPVATINGYYSPGDIEKAIRFIVEKKNEK